MTSCFSLFLLICYLLTCSVEGAKRLSADVWVEAALASRHDVPQSPVELLDLDPSHDLELVDTFNTVSGTLKIKYQQTYKDVPILGATLVLEQTKDGTFTTDAHGDFIRETEQDITKAKFPKSLTRQLYPNGLNELTEAEVLDISLKAFGVQKGAEVVPRSYKQVVYLDDNDQAHLAYELEFEVTANDTLSIPAYIIDMYSGEVLNTWPVLQSIMSPLSTPGGTLKGGKYIYGKEGRSPLMVTNLLDGTCKLKNDRVSVYNYKTTKTLPNDVYTFSCCEGIHDEVNGGYGPLADGLGLAEKSFEMHKEWYQTEAYTEKPLVVGVHYNKNEDNAYFIGNKVVFGDGHYYFHPLSASINIVGHEIAHGFTHQHSKLYYSKQSGGMNEAFSDMAGEALEYYIKGSVDWVLAESISKIYALRNYKNPPAVGSSIGHTKDYKDDMDPHRSSGIYNKATYILANKTNWDLRKAYNLLLIANKMYWTRNSSFCQGLKGNLKAAKDLGFSEADVRDAFKQVGVTTDC